MNNQANGGLDKVPNAIFNQSGNVQCYCNSTWSDVAGVVCWDVSSFWLPKKYYALQSRVKKLNLGLDPVTTDSSPNLFSTP